MSKPLRFHSEALEELTAEAVYYEVKSSGLGARFPKPAGRRLRPQFHGFGAQGWLAGVLGDEV